MTITQNEYDIAVTASEYVYDKTAQPNTVYNCNDTGTNLTLISTTQNTDSGFQAALYKDSVTNKYVVAYTGTDINEAGDRSTDWDMASDVVPGQFNEAKAFIDSVAAVYGVNNIEQITGHSMGGSLAQMIGALDAYKDINTVTVNAYGANHLLDNLAASGETLSSNYSNINNYGYGDDIVFRGSDQIGNVYVKNSNASLMDVLLDPSNKSGLLQDHQFSPFRYDNTLFLNLKFKDNISSFTEGAVPCFNLQGFLSFLRNNYLDIFYLNPISTVLASFHAAEASEPSRVDPLFIDLDGDGIETTTLSDGVYFDHDKNGFAQSSAWVGSDDGILVYDKNNNGTIDNGGEIFGDSYILKNGATATTGFQALADLDSDGNEIIDSADAQFANIKILKGDGTLETLTQAGIQSINLSNTTKSITDANGNTRLRTGSYTKTDASMGLIGDYSLAQNLAYSVATDWVEVSDAIAALPDAQGGGTVYSLHQAMARDTSGALKTLVQSFASTTDLTTKKTILTNIIYKWTGADAIPSTSRGINIDAKQLYALEKFMGENFKGIDGTANPNNQAANILKSSYSTLSNYIYAQLESQTTLKPLYDLITLEYDSATGTITSNLSAVTTAIQAAITANTTTGQNTLFDFDNTFKALGMKENSNYTTFYNTFVAMNSSYKFMLDASGKNTIYGTSGNDSLDGTANGEAYVINTCEFAKGLKLCA